MIDYNLDRGKSVVYVRPTGPLRKQDFDDLAQLVDPFIEESGGLNGLILETAYFPGWDNLGVVARHFRFIRDQHKKIKKVAIVTDSPLGDAAERIASHFVSATVKHFPGGGVEKAKEWAGS
ncbi:MAG TPA: STAS/SEC14 domain-containing protein [Candidatus Binatia bacterium]